MPSSHKRVKILVVAGFVLLIIAVLFVKKMGMRSDDYSIVYLTTGEVYVGKLRTFPRIELKDGYILQMTKDPRDETKTNFQLNPVKDALWATKSLFLVEKNIIFYGPLSPDSKIAQTLAGQLI